MFKEIHTLTFEEQVEILTCKLIKMESYSRTDGENHKTGWLMDLLSSFPYFQKNPQFLSCEVIEKDRFMRKNIFAFVKAPNESKKTIIYYAHIDTVGTEDFGALQSIAHHPDALTTYFLNYEQDLEVMEDAKSGEWLFGRGALDMQSGIAIHLANLLYFSENLDELDGNLLVMFNPDEESQHAGIRGAVEALLRLKDEHDLDYVAAINDDLISPLYTADHNKYIYTGTAGKLLPCFSIFGREAHVGESLSGIDPTIIASELNIRIGQNIDLIEKVDGELVLPASCLYMRDDKKQYDVQTALSCHMYFNYFFYQKSPAQIMSELLQITEEACRTFAERQKRSYQRFVDMNQLPSRDLDWTLEVTKLERLMEELIQKGLPVEAEMERVLIENRDKDDREIAFLVVDALQKLDPEKKPRVILYYAPPFLPSNYLDLNNERGMAISNKIKAVLEKEAEVTGESFKLKKYFPYLSDGSFLSFNGSEDEINSLQRNFPAMEELFPIPLESMKTLNIPSINVGVYGKGAHKWTERVYKPYSFNILPKLIRKITKALWEV
ncbi:M20/M25/M40 family metallo-hydrolase [Robertmurraya massiliosenegalensis]|uniref:M20/M25/M40 family metallo-hydrolase n=1 Tax=Robertmurraya TaxID=2837507 RepID=UPI0039A40952